MFLVCILPFILSQGSKNMIGRTSSTISLPSIRWLVSEAKHEKRTVEFLLYFLALMVLSQDRALSKIGRFSLAAMPLKNNHVCSEAAGFVSQHSQ